MKNDRAQYKYPREPEEFKKTFRRFGRINWKPSDGYSPTGFSETDIGEVTRSTSPFDRMRRNRRSQSDDRLLAHHVYGGFGGPPDRLCNIGLLWQPPECCEGDQRNNQKVPDCRLDTMRSTVDEVRHDCCFTMEHALAGYDKQPALNIGRCWERTSTQPSIGFQYSLSVRERNIFRSPMLEAIQTARSTLSDSDGNESMNANRLWLEVGETYSSYTECDSTAAINSAGPEASRRIGKCPGFRWPQSVWPIQWDSFMVESIRFVLQRWRGVCSFSQTKRSTRSNEESHLVCGRCSKNEVDLPARQLSGGENDYAQIKLKGSEI